MTMRKYLVIIHEDGHITAMEYEEPGEYNIGVSYNQIADILEEAISSVRQVAHKFRYMTDYGQGFVDGASHFNKYVKDHINK